MNHLFIISIEMQAIQKTPSKTYEQTNACTHPMSCSQVVAMVIFLLIQTLHLLLIPTIIQTNMTILYILTGLAFFTLITLSIDYIYLLCFDPADPRLLDPSHKQEGQNLQYCNHCEANVSQSSYHCSICKRCVQGFDHHCAFLNNCIGKRNYTPFIRLLISVLLHTIFNITLGGILTASSQSNYRWLALSFAVLSLTVFIQIGVLAIFHCYISCWLFTTTLKFLKSDKQDNKIRPQGDSGMQVDGKRQQQNLGVKTQTPIHK